MSPFKILNVSPSRGLGADTEFSSTSSFHLLKRGASGAFVVTVAGAGLGMAAQLIVARLIGQTEYGIYALMLSWISVLAVVAQMGQDVSVVRFLPTYVRNGEWDKVRGLRRAIGAWVFVASVVLACAGCAFVYWAGERHDATWRATFYIGFAMLPVLTQLQQSGAIHRAFKRAVASNVYIAVWRPVTLIVLLVVAAWSGARMDAPVAAAASAVAALLALLVSAWHLSRAWPVPARVVQPAYTLRPWLIVGAQLSVLSIIVVAGNRLDVLILGALAEPKQVGTYYAAAQMAGFALYGVQAVNVVLAPMIAERYDAGDLAGLQAVACRAARYGFLGALVAGIFFALIGKWALGLFGTGFEAAYVSLLILLFGYGVTSTFGEVGFMLSMTKYQKQASVFVSIGIATNCVAAIILVPRLGMAGAAIGAVLSLAVWRLLALRFVIEHLGIDPSIIGRWHRAGRA